MTDTRLNVGGYPSVMAALEAGEGYAVNIAQYTGKHVSTVRKILRGYEREGIAGRWSGDRAAKTVDYWVIVPPERRPDARRRHSEEKGATDVEQSTVATCRHVDCTASATRMLEIPMVTPGLPPLRDGYCDAHAEDILSDRMGFPGARELEDAA